jgi:hypothetical protein
MEWWAGTVEGVFTVESGAGIVVVVVMVMVGMGVDVRMRVRVGEVAAVGVGGMGELLRVFTVSAVLMGRVQRGIVIVIRAIAFRTVVGVVAIAIGPVAAMMVLVGRTAATSMHRAIAIVERGEVERREAVSFGESRVIAVGWMIGV